MVTKYWRYLHIPFVVLFVIAIASVHAQSEADPIPGQYDSPQAEYSGQPAVADPVTSSPIPANPNMAAGEFSNIHNDIYMSDTYTVHGPLGYDPTVRSAYLQADCASISFDGMGRIVATCLSLNSARLVLLDPKSLANLASLDLPSREISLDDLEFPASSYFYLDNNDRVIVPTINSTIWQVAITDEADFEVENTYDLTEVITEEDDIISVLPDFAGRLWFATQQGVIGTLATGDNSIKTLQLDGEAIANSFAVDENNGVYIVSDHAMYRLDADDSGTPSVTWREEYDRGTQQKPGQVSQGSGTTPTVMGDEYVVITDNAEPQMNVLVYRRAKEVTDDRLVCAVPVFTEGRSATENSVIATDHSIIVENNYGATLANSLSGNLSEPGMIRIDVTADEQCQIVWTSQERIPTVVSKLSLATGLVYTYTRDEGSLLNSPWRFTAINFETGETVWEQGTGTGLNFNNAYAGIYISPEGTAYVGVYGGIVEIQDGDMDEGN